MSEKEQNLTIFTVLSALFIAVLITLISMPVSSLSTSSLNKSYFSPILNSLKDINHTLQYIYLDNELLSKKLNASNKKAYIQKLKYVLEKSRLIHKTFKVPESTYKNKIRLHLSTDKVISLDLVKSLPNNNLYYLRIHNSSYIYLITRKDLLSLFYY